MRKGWVLAVLAYGVASSSLAGTSFSQYGLVDQFTLPASAPVDVLADGRLVTVAGADVFVESAAGSRQFVSLGTLSGADFSSYGPSFVRVSPDGTRLAVGNSGGASYANYAVGLFDLSTLNGDWFAVNHLDGAWIDDTRLALTGGVFGYPSDVVALDVTSDPSAPTTTTLVSNVGGSPGSVAFDAQGNLYTGNGYALAGPSGTGCIKAFAQTDWSAALAGGAALDFENGGALIGDVLSAGTFAFDDEGSLLVGGGDFAGAGSSGYAALLDSDALAAALAGAGAVDVEDATQMRRFDPDAADGNYYYTYYNAALGEIYVRDGAAVYVYAVPEPAAALGLLTLAFAALRRR